MQLNGVIFVKYTVMVRMIGYENKSVLLSFGYFIQKSKDYWYTIIGSLHIEFLLRSIIPFLVIFF